jgi:hypothetical protein
MWRGRTFSRRDQPQRGVTKFKYDGSLSGSAAFGIPYDVVMEYTYKYLHICERPIRCASSKTFEAGCIPECATRPVQVHRTFARRRSCLLRRS